MKWYDLATLVCATLAWSAILLFAVHAMVPLVAKGLSRQSRRLWFRHAAGWLLVAVVMLGLGWAAQIGGEL